MRCPFAIWRPLRENSTQGAINPTQIILHSAVDAPGDTSLYGYFNRADITVESHFFVKWDGTIEQYMDTEVRSDANRNANVRAISIETEDDGDPNQRPWSAAQMDALARLMDWLCTTHQIPRSQCAGWDRPGIGWHSMWGAPSPWTPAAGKTCPGHARIPQCSDLIRRVANYEENDEVTNEDIKAIAAHAAALVLNSLRSEGISGAADASHSNVDDAVIARIDALEQKIDAALAKSATGGLAGEATIHLTVN